MPAIPSPAKALSVQWTKHLPEEKKSDFEIVLRNSTLALGRLKTILQEELQSNLATEETIADYDDPNWSHKQAYRNGDRARIKKVLKLLEFIPN